MVSGSRALIAAEHALRVLKMFTEEHAEFGVTEVSQRLGLPKSDILQILSMLVQENVLQRDSIAGRYRMLPFLNDCGVIAEDAPVSVQLVRPRFAKMSRQLGEDVCFHIREGEELLTTSVAANGTVELAGKRLPLLATIPGIVILAFTENDPLRYISYSLPTPRLRQSQSKILGFLEMAEFEGYAEGFELNCPHKYTCACPSFNRLGNVIGVVSISVSDTTPRKLETIVKASAQLSQNLSIRLSNLQ